MTKVDFYFQRELGGLDDLLVYKYRYAGEIHLYVEYDYQPVFLITIFLTWVVLIDWRLWS